MNSVIYNDEDFDSDCTEYNNDDEIESPIIDISSSYNISKDRIEEFKLVEEIDDYNDKSKLYQISSLSQKQSSSYLEILSEINHLITPITSTNNSNKQNKKSQSISNKNNDISILNENIETTIINESSLFDYVKQNSKSKKNINNTNEKEKEYDALTQVEEMLLQIPQSESQSINSEIINEVYNTTEATSNESFDMEIMEINNLSPDIKISRSEDMPVITNEISDIKKSKEIVNTQKISMPSKLNDPSKVIRNAIFTLNKLIKNKKKFILRNVSIDLMLKELNKTDAINLNRYLNYINHNDRVKGIDKMFRLTYFTLLHKPFIEGVFDSLLNNK